MSSLRVSLGGSALPALLLVAHVTCGLFWFGSTRCPQLGFAQQMSHTSGSSNILGFPFQLRLSLQSSERSLLRSSLQKSHPCYLLPGLWLSEPCCKPHNLLLQTAGWKSRMWIPPSDASPRYSLVPGPHVQWPLCIFDNLGGHFLWWPFPSRLPWRSYISGIIIQMDLNITSCNSQWADFPSSPLSTSQCESVIALQRCCSQKHLPAFVCIHFGYNFELFMLPSLQTLPFSYLDAPSAQQKAGKIEQSSRPSMKGRLS